MSPNRIIVNYPSFPLTLRNLRLCLAGRFGSPMTQAEAAKKSGISRSHLANVEAGLDPASQFTLDALRKTYKVGWDVVRAAYSGSQAKLDRHPSSSKKKKSSTTQQDPEA